MAPGFIIKELQLSGLGVVPAIVTFEKGLNVIAGPTGTEKSYIFQCLNYMLGSSKKPKPITQAKPYNVISLSIESCQGQQYILKVI